MPCYPTVQKKAVKVGIKLPDGMMTDQETRDLVGAMDHEDLHRILDSMTDNQIKDLANRMLARKRKRAEAMQRYLETQGLVPAYSGAGVA